jgi:16S rRNA (guanine966-N2)-methyltransferase
MAGRARGRPLAAPRGDATRPTGDRVREAAFNLIGPVDGAAVLDLYAGSGALGLEALSRGAGQATFVDTAVGAVALNVGDLDVGARAQIVRGDAIRFLERDEAVYDLLLCDPPYRVAPRLGPELDRLLGPRMGKEGRVIVETATDKPIDLPSLPLLDERAYGGTMIRIHGRAA